MADIYVCSHGQTKPCDECSDVSANVVAPTVDVAERDGIDGEVVYLDLNRKGPQWIECPYCGLGTRAQVLRGQGVMTGWGECEHYYSASSDAATKPGLFFVRIPQPLTAAATVKLNR